jgi:hypothetical protein
VLADEHGTGGGPLEPGAQLELPLAPGRRRPPVQPGLEPGADEPLGDPLYGGAVARVVRDEDVEALIAGSTGVRCARVHGGTGDPRFGDRAREGS